MLARMDHDFVVRGDRRDPRPLSAAEVDAAVDRLAGSDLNVEAVADPASAGVTELRVRLSGPRSAGLVDAHRLAATLGWELYDPRRDWCWRDAGPVPPGFAADLPPGPGRRRTRWVATGGVPGAARGLAIGADGTAVVAYDPPRGMNRPPIVQIRSGADLERIVAVHPGLAAPVAVTAAGDRFAAAEQAWPSRDARLATAIRVADTDPAGRGVTWSLRAEFGWLAGDVPRLAALTRHPYARPAPLTGPAADELTRLESVDARVVVADTVDGTVTALAGTPLLHQTIYQSSNLAVAQGVVVVASCYYLTGHPLSGGAPWVQPAGGKRFHFVAHWHAAATSACGRLVAFGANHWRDDPNLVVVEAATGRMCLSMNTRAWGTGALVRAVAFHPAGWLAVGFSDGQVRHVTLTGSVVGYRGMSSGLGGLAFTPDGAALIVAGTDPRGLRLVELTPEERTAR